MVFVLHAGARRTFVTIEMSKVCTLSSGVSHSKSGWISL